MNKYIVCFTLISLFAACKKEDVVIDPSVQPPVIPEQPIWEKAVGEYKVFSLEGNYLYDMEISHIQIVDSVGNQIDSLHFTNFDGQFNFSAPIMTAPNFSNFVNLGVHVALLDTNDYRWMMEGYVDNDFYNNITNDEIPLYFHKYNTAYYLEDSTSIYECFCKQSAVKQQ
jgi:hypothetical protein